MYLETTATTSVRAGGGGMVGRTERSGADGIEINRRCTFMF